MSDKEPKMKFKVGDRVVATHGAHGGEIGTVRTCDSSDDTYLIAFDGDDDEFWKKGERLRLATPDDEPEEAVEKRFVPFTVDDFWAAVRDHGYELDNFEVSPAQCKALLPDCKALGGIQVWADTALSDDEIAVYIRDPDNGREPGRSNTLACTYHRGKRDYPADEPVVERVVLPDSNDLDRYQHQKMVETQNRSLALETSWLRAKLPDGRIIESPMPKAEDGWKEIWSDRWQEGEAIALASHVGVWISTPWNSALTVKSEELTIYKGHEELCCWWKDMGRSILGPENVRRDTVRHASILEAKKFRRKVEPDAPLVYWGSTGPDHDFHRQSEHVSDAADNTFYQGATEMFRAIHCPNPNWPENGHPGLSTSEVDPERRNQLPLLSGPESPRRKYDDRYWPQRHAPKPRVVK